MFTSATATITDLLSHFEGCDENFINQLRQRVNLPDYAKKIFKNAVTFEAWDKKNLVALIAAYFNDIANHYGYITDVSVVKRYEGKGIASELIKSCIEYARKNNFVEIRLEVSDDNFDAIKLYNKFNFLVYENKDNQLLMKLKLS